MSRVKGVAKGIAKGVARAGKELIEDKGITFAGAIAFFTALSLAPLVMILLGIIGWVDALEEQRVLDHASALLGEKAAAGLELVVENAEREKGQGVIATIVGVVTLLIGSTAVFAQLQIALNAIWDVEVAGGGAVAWLKKRAVSLGLVVTIGFLLLVSLVLNAGLRLALDSSGVTWAMAETVISLAIYVVIFAAVFKVLPDVHVEWRDVWFGAGVTALLFAIGKYAIGKYLGYSSVGSSYGAAGSLVVLLVWVYYSAIIVFFGAELTQVRARMLGRPIVADREIAKEAHSKPHAPPEPEEGSAAG